MVIREVVAALKAVPIAHRDVLIALALILAERPAPFVTQKLLLEPINEKLKQWGVASLKSTADVMEFLKLAKRHGFVVVTPDARNFSRNAITLSELGSAIPGYHTACVAAAVDVKDISLMHLYFHRKRLIIGESLSMRVIVRELSRAMKFGGMVEGAGWSVLEAYAAKVMKLMFNEQLQIDGITVKVLKPLRMY